MENESKRILRNIFSKRWAKDFLNRFNQFKSGEQK